MSALIQSPVPKLGGNTKPKNEDAKPPAKDTGRSNEDEFGIQFYAEQYGLEKNQDGGLKAIEKEPQIVRPEKPKEPAKKKKNPFSWLNPLNWFKSKKEDKDAPFAKQVESNEPFPKLPGQRFAGREVSLNKKLGKGGYGDVVKSSLCGGEVAAKIPIKESSSEYQEDYEKEVLNNAMVPKGEKNLLGFKGYTETLRSKKPSLLMEYAPHGDVKDKFEDIRANPKDKNNPASDLRYRFTTRDAIRGLNALHKKKLVHGDVKGQNIMLGKGFIPKVGDFGTLTKEGKGEPGKLGTDPYSAPENLEKAQTNKSDMWAMGETLLEGITGKTSVDMMYEGKQKPYLDSQKGDYTTKKAGNKDFFTNDLPKMLQDKNIDDKAVNLLKGLLDFDPDKRLSAEDALKTPYLTLSEQEEQQAQAMMGQK